MKNQLNGVFQITGWDETPYIENTDGTKQTHAKVSQSYSGDIEGSSELQYLMSYSPKGVAIFVGFETVSGSINGNLGSFIIQHNGKFEDGVASSDFLIVADSGKDKLIGISGAGTFKSADNGQANYTITIKD